MKILIATATIPKSQDDFTALMSAVRQAANEVQLDVTGAIWTGGPGCSNFALDIVGPDDDVELFAKTLTSHLMPAKWCETDDPIAPGDVCEITE